MILKIERYVGNKGDWWLLDDIRKISKVLIREMSFIEDVEESIDIFIFDFEQNLKDNGPDQKIPSCRDVIKLVCRLSNGNEFILLFDTLAYILNDNGKTIEKLVANCRYYN